MPESDWLKSTADDWLGAHLQDHELAREMILSAQLLGAGTDPLPAWRAASDVLAAEDWGTPPARLTYELLAAAHEDGEALGHGPVLRRAAARDVRLSWPMASWVSACRSTWCTPLPAETCRGIALEVRAAGLRRRAERVTLRLAQELHDGLEVGEALAAHQSELRALGDVASSGTVRRDELQAAADDLIQLAEHGHDPRQIPLGFAALDRRLWVYPASLTIVAGPTGAGKSTFALNVADNLGARWANEHDARRVLVFLLEMSEREVHRRRVLSGAEMTRRALIERRFHDWRQRILDSVAERRRRQIELVYESAMTPARLRSICSAYHQRRPLGLVVVDYLQLLAPMDPKASRERQVASAAETCKAIAMELEVPVLAVSSFSRDAARATEQKGRKPGGEPELHHLRDSGTIEYSADNVLLLNARGSDDLKTVAFRVAKQRNGPQGRFELALNGPLHRFEEGRDAES